ncbi:MAG: D-tyrosyl-tRNA(Tyr) deacylase [Fimbriimonadaceae bacterium]|nr:D-tyrosyl-tRNA(Tyr) deacylase [Fimbriimonadaceae bacterium]
MTVEGLVVGEIGEGLLVLAAAHRDDPGERADRMAHKVANLRIFNDATGKMNLSLLDLLSDRPVGVLAVSNFTVYGDATKNRRPSFIEAAPYDDGERLFERFVSALGALVPVKKGVFGAHMEVTLVNDGPVTIVLES